jgi:hypothetical protein
MSSLCSNVTSRTWRQNVIWPRLHAEHWPHLPSLSRAADCAACDNFFPFWVYYQYVNLRPHKLRNSCLISSDLSCLRGAVPRSSARTPTCVSMENSEVKRKFIVLTAPSRKIWVSETRSQFMYTPANSKESGAPLPPVRVCYAARVVWCLRITAKREHDVINHKCPEACGCRAGNHGQFLPMAGS